MSLIGPGGPFRCSGVVGRPYPKSASGREVPQDVREWSRVPTGCPGVVRRPS